MNDLYEAILWANMVGWEFSEASYMMDEDDCIELVEAYRKDVAITKDYEENKEVKSKIKVVESE